MMNFFWRRMAKFIAKPAIANRIIAHSLKHPYLHLPSNEDPSYMERYWVFNPYNRVTNKPKYFFWPWSVRVHHIKREDGDRALHDHPWKARTIILKGWYTEKRLNTEFEELLPQYAGNLPFQYHIRRKGDTAMLGFGEYHTICDVSDDGVWTLFISGPWQGVWGFLVDGVKIPWRTYLKVDNDLKPDADFTDEELGVSREG